MPHYVVTVVGADRPGIVAAVTAPFVQLGCNLEDSSASILRGHFALMQIVAGPEGLSVAELEKAVAIPAQELALVVTVREIENSASLVIEGERWTISVYGADKPGIVNRFATLLADKGINILDMTTRMTGEPSEPVYMMVLEVAMPEGVHAEQLEVELQDLALDLQVEASLNLADPDLL